MSRGTEQPGLVVVSEDRVVAESLEAACQGRGFNVSSAPCHGALPTGTAVIVLDLTAGADAFQGWDQLAATDARIVVLGTADTDLPMATSVAAWLDATASLEELYSAIQGSGPAACLPDVVRDGPFEALTTREREVLVELLQGYRVETIGERLDISVNTVRTHVQNVLTKLGVSSRAEAAALAFRHGLGDQRSRTSA